VSLGRVRARLYSDRHETLHVCSRELILLFGIQRYHVLGSSRCWALFGAVVSGSGPLYLDRHETLHVYVTGIVIIVWDTTVSCSRVVVVVGPCSGPLCRWALFGLMFSGCSRRWALFGPVVSGPSPPVLVMPG
jgi:hypothetical protein